jgi:hypothetical protein
MKDYQTRGGDRPRRKHAPMPASIDEIEITSEDEAFWDEEFLAESVALAMKAVRKLEAQNSLSITDLFPMRDLLFARWVGSLSEDEIMEGTLRVVDRLGDIPMPRLVEDGDVELPQEARLMTRLNQHLAESPGTVELLEYRRMVKLAHALQTESAAGSPQEQIARILKRAG